ncbi:MULTISPECIES: CsbD family protein [Crateriforma]|uniref:CsbD-like domain-containing protein n=1 Tax=Crateriforma conspicua TaxID=2527996 RepID=A0A5C6FXL4_9PLAN|nr:MULTISPECIES: CsbD family protein [Crateriforma]QDV63554.1 hypothetical protein Mal65_26980 [Crateriforma conspicua]TWT68943.1 hypothetical protein Pan14r_12270 [Crateriforma conspicua]TWU67126.1 hypothetical protein V7x_26990 [Crateriforma conspicua]
MIKREELLGRWNEVKGELREHWGQLTEDDLQRAKGSTEQLVGMVQQKTGATQREVENFLDRLMSGGSVSQQVGDAAKQYGETAQQIADDAAAYLRDGYRRVSDQSVDYSAKVADSVRSRPGEALAVAFGLGLAAGALFFMNKRR